MSLVSVIWSMAASACFTLSLIYLFVWCRDVRSLAYLYFSVCALSVGALALCELQMMFAASPVDYVRINSLSSLPLFIAVVTLVAFVYVRLPGSVMWLGIGAIGIRLVSLVFHFLHPQVLDFNKLSELKSAHLFGDQLLAYPVEMRSTLDVINHLSSFLLFLFIATASVGSWLRGHKQTAILVGGSLCFFIVIAAVHVALIKSGIMASPYFRTLPFLGILLVMGLELGSGLLQSVRLGERLKDTESTLRQSEGRLGVAAVAAHLGLWTWDIINDRIWMNDQAKNIIGMKPLDSVSFEDVLLKVHNDDRNSVRIAVEKAISNCGDYQCEFRLCGHDDQVRWISALGRIERSSSGKAAYLHGACSDITERRQYEERFRLVFESASNGFLITDQDGTILLANSEAERIFAYSRDSLSGLSIECLTGPVWLELRIEEINEPAEIPGFRMDGSSFPLSIGIKKIRTSLDSLLLCSMTDVTERYETERQAVLQRSEIVHLSRITMLGEVAGSIAHELNQPLTAIMTNAETAQRLLAKSPPDTTELMEILREVVDDVSRAAEVLRLLRVLEKKSNLEYGEVDLHSIVYDVARILKSEAGMRDITVNLELAETSPVVRGDRVQLEQVFLNLMLNAFDSIAASDHGTRIVTLETSYDDEAIVHVSVKDSGTGIDDVTQRCMFEPYFTSKANGLGLGLAICKTIVELHRGILTARNNSGVGATVTVSMPRFSGQIAQELGVTA